MELLSFKPDRELANHTTKGEKWWCRKSIGKRGKQMGKYDVTEKKLEEYSDVFADIYNVLVFGREQIQAEELSPAGTESIYKAAEGELRQQFRDTVKRYHHANLHIAELGIENQSEPEEDMPIRVMGYDYASYRRQMDEGKERYPSITAVLNFSDKPWNKPLRLKELFQVPREIMEQVADYPIKVYDIAFLPDEKIEKFQSTFKHVAHFLKNRRKGKNYQPLDEEIKHVGAFLDFLEVFTKDKEYRKIRTEMENRQSKGEKVTMCEVVTRFKNEGRAEGRAEGRIEGRKEMIKELLEELSAIPEELLAKIEAEDDLEILKKWSRLAMKAESVEDFAQRIESE